MKKPLISKANYKLDPVFHAHPKSVLALPPGAPDHPQYREVIRRIANRIQLSGPIDPATVSPLLPPGFDLPPGAWNYLDQLAAEHRASDPSGIEKLWLADYVKRPPDLLTFLTSPRYLGASLNPGAGQNGLWPKWQELLTSHFDFDSFVNNLVLTGAIGIGKSTILVILVLYRICLAAHLRDPFGYFGLAKSTDISFVLLSVSRDTLRNTVWAIAVKLLAQSPFFCEQAGFDPARTYASLVVDLKYVSPRLKTSRLILCGGSQSQHFLGRNTLAIALDEGNFRLESDPQNSAYQLFAEGRARMASRFQIISGFLPGLSIIASSATDESAFTEKLTAEIAATGDPRTDRVVSQPIYRLKDGLVLKPWHFRVAYGLPQVEPMILAGAVDDLGRPLPPPAAGPFTADQGHAAVPDGMRVEIVPGDYYPEFLRNPRQALQRLSGISIGGTHRLFPALTDIHKCLDLSVAEDVRSPSLATIIEVSAEDKLQIWDAMEHKNFVVRAGAGYAPRRHPLQKRYAHLDLATTGRTGLAICHLVPRAPGADDAAPLAAAAIVEFDFIVCLAGGAGQPIALGKIQNFINWLRKACGFPFGLVSADMHESLLLMQNLHGDGFETDLRSVDRTKSAYLALRSGFEAGAVRLYPHEIFLSEAAELLELARKIDHPPGGSKDVADAVAGAYLNAISSAEMTTLTRVPDGQIFGGPAAARPAADADPFGLLARVPPRRTQIFNA